MAPTKRVIHWENHHWVPELLLRNFRGSDGRVFRLEKSTGKISKLGTRRIASRANFNELLVNGEPRSFEPRFQEIEARAGRPLKGILQSGSLKDLTSKEKFQLAQFIAAQSFRTDAYRRGVEARSNTIPIGELLELHFESLPALTEMVFNRYWALMVCSPQNEFFLGDHPVILQRSDMAKSEIGLGWDVDGVDAILPISPTMALYLPAKSTGEEILNGVWNALRVKIGILSGVIQLSCDKIQPLERALLSGWRLYSALRNGHPLPADGKNVDNLNSQQCGWASNEIFSRTGDFAFAQRVFRETPSYLKIPEVNVVRVW